MKNLYRYPTIISFIPSIFFIPLIINLITNFHLGGFDLFLKFISSAFNPSLDNGIILISIKRLIETFTTALISWLISLIFGVFLGIITSDEFFEILNLPKFIKISLKFSLTIIRSIHELVWCLLLMQIYGINSSVAIIAICIPYSSVNAKVISDQLNNLEIKNIESIIQIKGNIFSSLITLFWSPIINTLKNFGIYRFECALRSTAILGLFGIGGIGTSIYLSFQALNFKELWTYLWGLALLIISTKLLFKKIKSYKFDPEFSLTIIILTILLFLFSIYYALKFLTEKDTLNLDLITLNSFSILNIKLVPFEFLELISETILISLFAIFISIALPPILIVIFENTFQGKLLIRSIAFWLRVIPPPVLIMILLIFNRPSISLAALTLGIHNAAITSKLLLNNLDNVGRENYLALRSIGAPKKISFIIGLFSPQAKSYLAYCSYRADIIIRETAIVSSIGAVGLGSQLIESLSSFAWTEVMVILFSYCSISTIGEIINGKIKSYLN